MTEDLIILYDIPSAVLPDKAWSPNVWKTRFVLNYKGLSYRTEWVETPDLGPVAKKIGAPPSMFTNTGEPRYCAPIIYCPRTRKYVSNSLEIAIHLEHTYPEAPPLFCGGLSEALVRAWDEHWNDSVTKHMIPLMALRTCVQLTPRSAAGFRWSRERLFGTTLEDLASEEKMHALWQELRNALARFDGYMRGTSFVAKDQITYPDVVAASWLVWMKRLCGRSSNEWQQIEGWNEGRWKKLTDAFSKWEYTESFNQRPGLQQDQLRMISRA